MNVLVIVVAVLAVWLVLGLAVGIPTGHWLAWLDRR